MYVNILSVGTVEGLAPHTKRLATLLEKCVVEHVNILNENKGQLTVMANKVRFGR